MRTLLLVVLALLTWPVVAHSASAGPPVLDPGSPASLWVGVAAGPDATRTEVWLLHPGVAPTGPRFTVDHPAGQVPHGAWDEPAQSGWLVVEEGRPGSGARLLRWERGGEVTTVLHTVASLARPVVVPGGVLLSTGSVDDGDLALVRVDDQGVREVFRAHTPWMLPAGVDGKGDACALVRDGNVARMACGAGGVTRWTLPSALARHASVGREGAWALVENAGAWSVERTSPAARWPATMDASLVVAGTTAAWGLGAGAGVRILQHDKERDLLATRGFSSSPAWANDAVVVVRLDSVDASGRVDGRMPTGWQVLDLAKGGAVRVRTGGRVMEVYGAGGSR